MKKIISVLLVFAMVLGFAGCGKKEEPRESVSLTVWVGENYVDVTNEMVKAFVEANKDKADFSITVGIESESTAGDTVLTDPTAAADIYTFADDQLTKLVTGKAIQPVNDTEYITSNMGEGAVSAASKGGTLYAYPMSATNGYFLYYNKNFFTEADIQSFNTMAEKAAAANKAVGFELGNSWYTYGFFKGAGLNCVANDDNTANVCDWNNDTGVKVLQGVLDLVNSGGLVKISDSEGVQGTKDGKLVATVNGSWNEKAYQEALGDGFACAKLPSFKVDGKDVQMGSFAGYKLLGVNPYSKNVGWAMELAKFMVSEENQLKRFEAVGDGPTNTKAAQDPKVLASPTIAALAAQSAYATTQNVTGNYWTPVNTLFEIINQGGTYTDAQLKDLLNTAVEGIVAPVQ